MSALQYVIERTPTGAGKLSRNELQAIAVKSNAVLRDLGADVQWVHSHVTGEKIYCVYNAKIPRSRASTRAVGAFLRIP